MKFKDRGINIHIVSRKLARQNAYANGFLSICVLEILDVQSHVLNF